MVAPVPPSSIWRGRKKFEYQRPASWLKKSEDSLKAPCGFTTRRLSVGGQITCEIFMAAEPQEAEKDELQQEGGPPSQPPTRITSSPGGLQRQALARRQLLKLVFPSHLLILCSSPSSIFLLTLLARVPHFWAPSRLAVPSSEITSVISSSLLPMPL